jgi:GT2 family glycosyltransferase
MNVACVIPVGAHREQNLTRVMNSLAAGKVLPKIVVVVLDGEDAQVGPGLPSVVHPLPHVWVHRMVKHEPGLPQPRNVGAHYAQKKADELGIELTHFWFVDSDCIVSPEALLEFQRANVAAATEANPKLLVGQRILIGRYDWLAQGSEGPQDPLEMADPRDDALRTREPSETFVSDLSAGLACFSGNLMWPAGAFERVGGFWNELHHGRCEDGELGLRAVKMGIPIAFVGAARAWHLWHPSNVAEKEERNARDVPMLNERHPWLESRCWCGHQKLMHNTPEEDGSERGTGGCKDCECKKFEQAVFIVEEDGKRFNVRCACGWEGNTVLMWRHEAQCPLKVTL